MFDLIYRFDPKGRHVAQAPADALEAVERLDHGNTQFSDFLVSASQRASHSLVFRFDADDLGFPRPDGTSPKQTPFAAVLGCSDARVPIEMIFGQACNDLFVVRVAGNVLGAECMGSLDYALANLGDSLKLIVVLGHSGCGAVTAAVDAFIHPTRYLAIASNHQLRAIVDRVYPAVRGAHAALESVYNQDVEQLPGYRSALTETSIVLNAALTAASLEDTLGPRLGPNRSVVFGVYNLHTKRVCIQLESTEAVDIRLSKPPKEAEGFQQLGRLIAASGTIRQLLFSGPAAAGHQQ
jgi:carbonic anhydrase